MNIYRMCDLIIITTISPGLFSKASESCYHLNRAFPKNPTTQIFFIFCIPDVSCDDVVEVGILDDLMIPEPEGSYLKKRRG